MAHPYHHSLSSVRKWGGTAADYQRIRDWFDESKRIIADFRHHALRLHAEGIFMAETIFGSTIRLSSGRVVPVRWIGERHVREGPRRHAFLRRLGKGDQAGTVDGPCPPARRIRGRTYYGVPARSSASSAKSNSAPRGTFRSSAIL